MAFDCGRVAISSFYHSYFTLYCGHREEWCQVDVAEVLWFEFPRSLKCVFEFRPVVLYLLKKLPGAAEEINRIRGHDAMNELPISKVTVANVFADFLLNV